MPLPMPTFDSRKYQDILDEALARVPVHNPEWTNFNKSDPGVTLIEVFSFLTESLLYRANQIPERNRLKFLSLLGVGLAPGASARGLVSFSSTEKTPSTVTLEADVEVLAGQVPFRTETGLDVLPIEAQAFYKQPASPDDDTVTYYNQLYSALRDTTPPSELKLYQTTPFSPRGTTQLNLGRDTTDHSLWIALLLRPTDKPYATQLEKVREALAGKTLSLGVVPALAASGKRLAPGGAQASSGLAVLNFQVPKLPPGGVLPESNDERDASYRTIKTTEVPTAPSVVQITLPEEPSELALWSNLDPLEAGSRDFPPSLEGMEQDERIITWIRIVPSAPAQTNLLWTGINTVFATQRAHVRGELLPPGTGEPDQVATLSQKPVVSGSVTLRVTTGDKNEIWQEIDDLGAAGPEVPVPDLRAPPGTPTPPALPSKVYALDPESGQLRFGDGLKGARPPSGAILRVDYDFGVGQAGNVGIGAIGTGPTLPPAIKVTNCLATWGGADAETVAEGERQVPRFLQHRDRLVSEADFETIALRTPGVAIGRVDVLSAYHPGLSPNQPGNAPGAVTIMALPKYDNLIASSGPDTFLDAIACWLEPRRLVTTEVFVRRPDYRRIWVSIGLDVVAGVSVAALREAVARAVRTFLSPLPDPGVAPESSLLNFSSTPQVSRAGRGWPLFKPVLALELAAIANRVDGVAFVKQVLLSDDAGKEYDQIPMVGLELPLLAGLSVAVGDAVPIDQLRGTTATATGGTTRTPFVPVPFIPREC